MLSGYMLAEELVTIEESFEGPRWNSKKVPKLRKAKPPPAGKGVSEGRERVRALLGSMNHETNEPPDMSLYE